MRVEFSRSGPEIVRTSGSYDQIEVQPDWNAKALTIMGFNQDGESWCEIASVYGPNDSRDPTIVVVPGDQGFSCQSFFVVPD